MFSRWRTALTPLALMVAIALPIDTAMARNPHQLKVPESPGSTSLASEPAMAAALPPGQAPSGTARRLADWAAVTNDNGDLPFLIVDKVHARIFAFDASGLFLGSAPILIGLSRGDDSAAGVGELKLAEISADQRITPAGRFLAAFGASMGHGLVFWVDRRDGIALHPVMSVNAGERRLERIQSSDPAQHRISYGCINVPTSFYQKILLTALVQGEAVVYVLPDTKSVDEVFPNFAASASNNRRGDQLSSAERYVER